MSPHISHSVVLKSTWQISRSIDKKSRLGLKSVKDLLGKGQTYEASTGNHDDLVMNLVLFGYFVSSAYFANLTDINIKDMIFNQKLKAIEEDIVPFGFIDDGSEQIKKIEIEDDPRQQWQIEYDRDL